MYFLDGLCDCPRLLMPALGLVKKFIDLLKILVPIALIIWGIIDLTKAVMASDDSAMKKAQGALVKKILAAVCVFLVPTIMNAVLSIVANGTKGEVDTGNWASCWSNVGDYESECGSGTNNNGTVGGGSASYLCGNFSSSKYVWTDSPDSKVCSKLADITTEGECLKKNSYDYIDTDGKCYNKASAICPSGTTDEYLNIFDDAGSYSCFYKDTYGSFSAVIGNDQSMSSASERMSSIDCSGYADSKLIGTTKQIGSNIIFHGICATEKISVCPSNGQPKQINKTYYCEVSCTGN